MFILDDLVIFDPCPKQHIHYKSSSPFRPILSWSHEKHTSPVTKTGRFTYYKFSPTWASARGLHLSSACTWTRSLFSVC